MSLKTFCLSLVALSLACACSPKLSGGGYDDGEVRFYEKGEVEKGIVPVLAIGVDRNQEAAKARAKMHAVKSVLFRGVPGSNVQRPIVDQDIQERKKNYFDKFFSTEGEYLDYIVETAMEPDERRKVPSGYRVGVYVKVFYSQLQSKLENDGIIKKMGI